MSSYTHETSPTEYLEVGGTRFAYRRFGKVGEPPLLMLNYFAANMDDWDSRLTNGFAAHREVLLLDYPGVGNSTGEMPDTIAALTEDCAEFVRKLDLRTVDVVGFSLGGMIAQQLASEYPDIVRRMILLGTAPRGGEGLTFSELSVEELADPEKLLRFAFFTPSEASQAAAQAYLERLRLRTADRDAPVSDRSASTQLAAIREWGVIPPSGRYAMLDTIHQPTLIVHGGKDVVVAPINAFLLAQHLPNAQLLMYPDASHGVQSQYADLFLNYAGLFLEG